LYIIICFFFVLILAPTLTLFPYTTLFRSGLGPSVHLDARQLLTEMGMDSLMAVELSNHLQASLACKLPPTLAFEYPSISALAEYLATDVLGWAPPGNGGNGTDAPADGQPVITHSAVME